MAASFPPCLALTSCLLCRAPSQRARPRQKYQKRLSSSSMSGGKVRLMPMAYQRFRHRFVRDRKCLATLGMVGGMQLMLSSPPTSSVTTMSALNALSS